MQRVKVRSLVGEIRSHIPHGQKKQNINNRSNTVTNSIKTLKWSTLKKKKKLRKISNHYVEHLKIIEYKSIMLKDK